MTATAIDIEPVADVLPEAPVREWGHALVEHSGRNAAELGSDRYVTHQFTGLLQFAEWLATLPETHKLHSTFHYERCFYAIIEKV